MGNKLIKEKSSQDTDSELSIGPDIFDSLISYDENIRKNQEEKDRFDQDLRARWLRSKERICRHFRTEMEKILKQIARDLTYKKGKDRAERYYVKIIIKDVNNLHVQHYREKYQNLVIMLLKSLERGRFDVNDLYSDGLKFTDDRVNNIEAKIERDMGELMEIMNKFRAKGWSMTVGSLIGNISNVASNVVCYNLYYYSYDDGERRSHVEVTIGDILVEFGPVEPIELTSRTHRVDQSNSLS